MNLFKLIKAKIFHKRLAEAIKEADNKAMQSGKRVLVLNFNGRPIVKTKNELKNLIHSGFLRCDIQTIENIALYKTY